MDREYRVGIGVIRVTLELSEEDWRYPLRSEVRGCSAATQPCPLKPHMSNVWSLAEKPVQGSFKH